MTKEFNTCADLLNDKESIEYATHLVKNTKDPFQEALNIQELLQIILEKKYPERCTSPANLKTKGELIDFIKDMQYAINDEFSELIEAIHGMSRPASERTAGWKKWKSKYNDIRNEEINENLNENDIIERNFEMIDIMHFVLNCLLALDIDAKDFYMHYFIKNKENIQRYENNY